MKKIANKINAKRYIGLSLVIFTAIFLTIIQLVALTGDEVYWAFVPFTLPIIAVGCILQWNFDFSNSTFAEKRKMVIELNAPEELY